jgi:hypothetical protein
MAPRRHDRGAPPETLTMAVYHERVCPHCHYRARADQPKCSVCGIPFHYGISPVLIVLGVVSLAFAAAFHMRLIG